MKSYFSHKIFQLVENEFEDEPQLDKIEIDFPPLDNDKYFQPHWMIKGAFILALIVILGLFFCLYLFLYNQNITFQSESLSSIGNITTDHFNNQMDFIRNYSDTSDVKMCYYVDDLFLHKISSSAIIFTD